MNTVPPSIIPSITEDIDLKTLDNIFINLADEGVPLKAIARATKTSSDIVRETLDAALESGELLQHPPDDWQPGSLRGNRAQMTGDYAAINERVAFTSCIRLFKVTRVQACLLDALIRRKEVTREMLHTLIERNRLDHAHPDETDIKMVDVVICHIRKRLKPFDIQIKTLWSTGYFIDPEQRKKAQDMLVQFIHSGIDTSVPPIRTTTATLSAWSNP